MKKNYSFFRSNSTASFNKSILAVLLLLSSMHVKAWQGNGSMACNDNVQVSLDYNCQATITPDMILEGSNNGPANLYNVRISNITGNIVTKPGFHTVTVTNIQTNNNCWGTISVEDKLPPLVDNCPCAQNSTDPACQFYCVDLEGILNGTIAVPTPVVYENCTSYTTIKTDQVIDGQCGGKVIKRSYVFTDASGNKSTPCVSYYVLNPVDLDDVTPPSIQVQLTCGANTTPEGIFDFFKSTSIALANKNAYPTLNGSPIKPGPGVCNVLSTFTDVSTLVCGAQCSNSKKVLRTWLVLDWCTGQSATFIQQIKATDNQAPTIIAADLTVSTDPWGCFANIEFPAPTTLHDNCTSTVTYDVVGGPIGTQIVYDATDKTYTALNVPKGDYTFTYRATDCCGNVGTDVVNVTIVDKTAPVAVSKQNVVVSLTTSGPGLGIAKVYTNSIDNGSHDGCTPVHLELRRDEDACNILGNTTYNNDGHTFDNINDPDNGAFIKFCCADLTGVENGVPFGLVKVWLRVWDDGDMNGVYGSSGDNFNETWSWVRVEDKLPPTIKCPADVTIRCDEDYTNLDVTGKATGGRTCEGGDVEYTDSPALNSCGIGTILRKWNVKGFPSTFCTQKITIRAVQDFNPSTIKYPVDITTDCKNLPDESKPTWVDAPCNLVGYAIDSDTFKFEDGACFKIINKFTVINWCTYQPNSPNTTGIWYGSQIIKVMDNTAPVISCTDIMSDATDATDIDNDGNKCELVKGWKLSNTATDNGDCASKWLKWIITIDLWGDGVADYEYNSLLPSNDNTFNDSNNNGVKDKYISPTSSGEMVMVEMPEDISGSMSNHKIHWRVTDGCGNVSACTQNLMVVDKKKPTPYCISLSTALMKDGRVELWARDFDLNSFDNCTAKEDLLFTFNEESPVPSKIGIEHFFKGQGQNATLAEFNEGLAQRWVPAQNSSSQIFNCDDLPKAQVKMTVWDKKGNWDFCEVELTLVDNQGACSGSTRMVVSGKVRNEAGIPMKDVNVGLKNMNLSSEAEKITDLEGSFSFDNVIGHLNYELKPVRNTDYLNGVSTLDLVLIQRHILNVTKLNSAYKIISADINNDQKLTAADLVELRRLILGTSLSFSNNNSWRFVSTRTQFADPTKPWPFVEKVEIADISIDMAEDFIACKVGDVNNTAITNLKSENAEERSKESEVLTIEEQVLEQDQTYTIALNSSNPLAGYQFAVELHGLQVLKASGQDFTSANYSLIGDKLLISWNDVKAAQGEIIYLEVKATSPGKLSDKLSIAADLSPEAYTNEAESRDLKIKFLNSTEIYDYALLQNEPNPFAGKTKISFTLPTDDVATLSIYDMAGRIIYTNTAQYTKGVNTVDINTADMGTSGVMFYKLESGSFSETKKMIDLK